MSEKLLIVGDKVLITEDSLLTVPVDTNLQDKTVTPAIYSQIVTSDTGYLGLNKVTVEAMPTATQATPSIEVDSSGLITASATQDSGYVAAGTKSATEQLPVQEAQTIMPGTADKTIEAGKYLTGIQTVKGDANLVSENIAKDIVIFGVTGTHQSGEDVTAELTEQDELIEQIQVALEGKAAAGTEKPFAIIGVTYPEGSTCTCSKDEIVLTLESTNGEDFFFIPEAGTWVVTAGSKSKSVSITTEGQFEKVNLSELILFDGGDNTAVTGGWGIKGHNTPDTSKVTVGNELYITITGTQGANYKVWPIYPINTIDLSEHSTMKAYIKAGSNISGVFSLAILTNIDINYAFASGDPLAQAYITSAGENSLDISSVTGKCYPCIVGEISSGGGTSANLTATKIWLE